MSERFLIVGAGFFGAVCARELTDAGHRCLVLEKRDHIGGNCYTRYNIEAGCNEHVYGPHIFHTDSSQIWSYLRRFGEFNSFVNRPKVKFGDRIFSFPINLFTLYQIYGVKTPEEASQRLERSKIPIRSPENLEEWCLSQVGRELYEIFFKGYTQKQWGRDPKELPASLVRRLPIRMNFDDNYYRDRFQGIPIGGYTALFEQLLKGVPVVLGVDFLGDRDQLIRQYDHVIYSGPVDAFFDNCEGVLDYRSLRFESRILDLPDYQGNAQINFTEYQVPYTRSIEHKHFDLNFREAKTLVTREYPQEWKPGMVEFYPVATARNQRVYDSYRALQGEHSLPVTFGGRLGEYRYFDMHQVIGSALRTVRNLLGTGGRKESHRAIPALVG